MEGRNRNQDALKRYIDSVKIIDTHEHLYSEDERLLQDVDVLATFLPHYASSDLVSAGMSLEDLEMVRNPKLPLRERWAKFAPFWEKIANTGYARAIDIALRDLYDVNGLNDATYEEASKKLKDANKRGVYHWILKEKSGIDISILDSIATSIEDVERFDLDRSLFAPVMRFDPFIVIKEKWEIEALAKRVGMPIHSLRDLERALELYMERLRGFIVGVKIALAYRRSLHFDKPTYDQAERVFNRIYAQTVFKRIEAYGGTVSTTEALSFEEAKPLQDFMAHKVVGLAAKNRLPIQIHTGLQERNENLITNASPVNLTNLFTEYKEARFDVFHGGYPYTSELAVLAKNFPNVYVDMCWLHIISPWEARRALSEWLDTVPGNKIFAFGGDYLFVEGVYAHAKLARQNVRRVLQERIDEGAVTEKQAIVLAERLLRKNALELFFPKGIPPS
jgi:predicted TIM-barrel fold metal-dependent hydrolase